MTIMQMTLGYHTAFTNIRGLWTDKRGLLPTSEGAFNQQSEEALTNKRGNMFGALQH